MPDHSYFSPGLWNFVCDQCGRVFKSDHMRKRWDGATVCDTGTCWETRQPQDFVRAIKEDIGVPIARPWVVTTASASTLGANITAAANSLTVHAGDGTGFPVVGAAAYYLAIADQTNPQVVEYVKVGAHAAGSDSFTGLTRGQLGTTAHAFTTGALISLVAA